VTLRRPFLSIALLAAIVLVAIAALDFAKALRDVPALVAPQDRADRILVEKSARRLVLLRDGKVLRSYAVALGGSPVGDKLRQGDRRTPVGRYVIDFKNAESAFHLSLRISYPDRDDREEAAARGDDPGGDIMIHGLPNGFTMLSGLHRMMDWTDGCIAVTNAEIEEI
jgi:murein L,D-transpeptidase YafK